MVGTGKRQRRDSGGDGIVAARGHDRARDMIMAGRPPG